VVSSWKIQRTIFLQLRRWEWGLKTGTFSLILAQNVEGLVFIMFTTFLLCNNWRVGNV
jgi:hypothetical protein